MSRENLLAMVANPALSDSRLANLGARAIADGYVAFADRFRIVTRRARIRFINRDWKGMRADSFQRFEVYNDAVSKVIETLRSHLGIRLEDRHLWALMKAVYSGLIQERDDWELAETFFNSVTRKIFVTVGVDANIEFVDTDFDTPPHQSVRPISRSYIDPGDIAVLLERIITDADLGIAYPDLAADCRQAGLRVAEHLRRIGAPAVVDRADIVDSIFYRGKAAYLVGRVTAGSQLFPLVLAVLHPDGGGQLDAVLLTENQVSILFSFTRSYFHTDVARPYDLMSFLRSLMPRKRMSELYISIGQHKHGKTSLYRELLFHLAGTGERFSIARGTKGLVMAVFTLSGFDVVIKVIKDRFPAPKRTTRREVRERYQLVFRTDRAGRLVDAQEFEFLEFDRSRFDSDLLELLRSECGRNIEIFEQKVVIRHAYIERRVIPLDLYLRDSDPELSAAAIVDYGHAIKELAATGIFPGDLLLKNFGVTRHGRVVFYDYDELTTIAKCVFRPLPADADDSEEPSFGVGPDDVFPEEFERFLGVEGDLKAAFMSHHADLLTAHWWLAVQQRVAAGELIDIFPYDDRARLATMQSFPVTSDGRPE
ncbi:MAG TPA: bifunctional isocitrate dehydrogenase kinase/phosphatase [Acidimicrobiia bacterium]|nr:bifunctional isocitrate dehydrogenase kinase/phosphatase [Acidimicrobiia bacterium]